LLFPNLYQPNWFIEGLATYYETDALKGIGRGQSSLFQMMMRSEVEQGIKPISQVNLPIRSWPMGTVSYLYGVHFYQFLEDTYGQQGIENLIDNYSDNIIPFMINTNTEHVFDKNVTELWSDFSFWLQKRYQPEVLAQHKAGLVEGKKITDLGYNTSVLDHAYDGRYYIEGYDEFIGNAGIYYIADGAFEHAALMQRINHKTHFVINVHRGAKINTHPEAGVLIIQNEFCDEYNVNSDLYLLANDKSHLKRITECGRYRSASWSADGQSIVAIKTEKGKSQLVLLSTNGELIKTLWSGNNTDIATQLKTSPLGKYLVAAVFRETSGWNIEEFNLENLSWKAITHDHYIDMYPSYSEKGDAILFSSDRLEKGQEKDKVNRYQIYRYVKENAEIQQLTRVKNGAFSPIQNNLKSPLYYVGYHSSGRDIYQLDNVKILSQTTHTEQLVDNNKHRVSDEPDIPEVKISSEKNYSALSSLRPRGWLPFISLNKDREEIHNYFLTLAYDAENEWLIGNIKYAYANRFSMGYRRSTDIIRDRAGKFAIARNVDDLFLSVGFNKYSISVWSCFKRIA